MPRVKGPCRVQGVSRWRFVNLVDYERTVEPWRNYYVCDPNIIRDRTSVAHWANVYRQASAKFQGLGASPSRQTLIRELVEP